MLCRKFGVLVGSMGTLIGLLSLLSGSDVYAQPATAPGAREADAVVFRAATAQRQPLLDSLKAYVNIETGSRDVEGIVQATDLLATQLRSLGGQVAFVEPAESTTYRMADSPEKIGRMVRATFTGSGTKRILLIAHIDTVYL